MFAIENAQSVLGVVLILGFCWAISEARGRFPWRLAIGAVAAQAGLVVLLFALPVSRAVLAEAGLAVQGLSSSTQTGVSFVFGFLGGGAAQPYAVTNQPALFVLAFRVLPVILVICALSALLWHWRILKWLVQGFGLVFERAMGLRGAPALATAATIFMGQVEGPIFIRAYLSSLTRSELFLLLSVGMSCVAGSTVVAYATILQGVLPNAAAHVLTASLISAPAGVLLARILVPRDPAEETSDAFDAAHAKTYDSSIDALMRGTTDGLQIVLAIAATLVVFVALVALADNILGLAGPVAGAPLSVAGLQTGPDRIHRLHQSGQTGPRNARRAQPGDHDLRPLRLRQYRLGRHQCGRLFDPGSRAPGRDHGHGVESMPGWLPRNLPHGRGGWRHAKRNLSALERTR
jgi:CNT family concentrative nucleoside transporter